MNVAQASPAPWLLFVFSLPSKSASARVGIWRKLQRFGSVGFRNSGYLLPNDPVNIERFEWLARSVRESRGEASVLRIQTIDDLPDEALQEQFRVSRRGDYEEVLAALKKLKRNQPDFALQLAKIRQRRDEIAAIDFFQNPLRAEVDKVLARLTEGENSPTRGKRRTAKAYEGRVWVTRPRPGIDRVSSAWLITRFIDKEPTFTFADEVPSPSSEVVPFDMYGTTGFGHEGDRCTFETLCRHFDIKDKSVRNIAEAIHDADIEDGRYGRGEGIAINAILRGWDRQGLSDEDLLKRGMDLIEGLYLSLSETKRRGGPIE